MKKNKPKYLAFYRRWIKTGKMNCYGLCDLFDGKKNEYPEFLLVQPTEYDSMVLERAGVPSLFWGSETYRDSSIDFTPRRQTIVLLMAALNNEL